MQIQNSRWMKRGAVAVLVVLLVVAAVFWRARQPDSSADNLVSGNGRVEAIEVDIAARSAGRIAEILVDEGDYVSAGQVVARMDTSLLEAERARAQAQLSEAEHAESTTRAFVLQRQSERAAGLAALAQRQADRELASKRFKRGLELRDRHVLSEQDFEEIQAQLQSAEAAVQAARAQIEASQAAIQAAKSQAVQARSQVDAAAAAIARIQVDLDDAQLKAPRDGRIQYRLAQPGEVIGAGGKLLNMVDLSDVFVSFFLPETVAGRVALGAEVRLVLDAAPEYVFPARVSFVASVAQFTPKTVETQSERQKLMFRVKAQLDPALLRRYSAQVKPGLPGVGYLRRDPAEPWPAHLQVKLP